MSTAWMLLALGLAQAPVLTFDQALERAEEKNTDLRVAEARLQQARQSSWKAWSSYLPQLAVGGGYTRNNNKAEISLPTGFAVNATGPVIGVTGPPGEYGLPTNLIVVPTGMIDVEIQKLEQWGAQATLSQTLISPALIAGISAAYKGEEVAGLSVENARREVLFGVAQAYLGSAAAREVVSVFERQRAVAEAHLKDAKVRHEAGALPQVGLLRAQIDLTRAERDLERAINNYRSAKLTLGTLLDLREDFEVETPPEPQLDEALISSATPTSERPDLRAARAQVELNERLRLSSWLKYAPNIGANGAYRWSNVGGFTGENRTWFATIGLQWNLLDGGLREAEIREQNAKVAEARAALRGTENRAHEELARAALDLRSARANAIKAEEQVKLARENNRLVELSFKSGVSTPLEVSDAQASLLSAETAVVGEKIQAAIAALRLMKAHGVFPAAR